jgi:hypothetical protein
MKRHLPFALLATLLVAADAPQTGPAGQQIELPEGVTHVALPPGAVQWENVRAKDGMILRVTAGKTTVEGKRLYYGDGKLAVEIAATAEGMHFVQWTGWKGPGKQRISGNMNFSVKHGIVIDGEHVDEPGVIWCVEPNGPKPGELKPGSVYITTPSIKFEREAALKRGADGKIQAPPAKE